MFFVYYSSTSTVSICFYICYTLVILTSWCSLFSLLYCNYKSDFDCYNYESYSSKTIFCVSIFFKSFFSCSTSVTSFSLTWFETSNYFSRVSIYSCEPSFASINYILWALTSSSSFWNLFAFCFAWALLSCACFNYCSFDYCIRSTYFLKLFWCWFNDCSSC